MVLLVIDVQAGITNEHLYRFSEFTHHLHTLMDTARKNKVEVLYLRHDDGPGAALTPGKPGFEIHPDFAPKEGEQIFDKTVNSAFKGTGLLEYLTAKGEKDLIAAGLQTDYCLDATIKCGFEHGFHILVPAFANTTVDNPYMTAAQSYAYYNTFQWPGRYAACLPVEAVVAQMKAHKAMAEK